MSCFTNADSAAAFPLFMAVLSRRCPNFKHKVSGEGLTTPAGLM